MVNAIVCAWIVVHWLSQLGPVRASGGARCTAGGICAGQQDPGWCVSGDGCQQHASCEQVHHVIKAHHSFRGVRHPALAVVPICDIAQAPAPSRFNW